MSFHTLYKKNPYIIQNEKVKDIWLFECSPKPLPSTTVLYHVLSFDRYLRSSYTKLRKLLLGVCELNKIISYKRS